MNTPCQEVPIIYAFRILKILVDFNSLILDNPYNADVVPNDFCVISSNPPSWWILSPALEPGIFLPVRWLNA